MNAFATNYRSSSLIGEHDRDHTHTKLMNSYCVDTCSYTDVHVVGKNEAFRSHLKLLYQHECHIKLNSQFAIKKAITCM